MRPRRVPTTESSSTDAQVTPGAKGVLAELLATVDLGPEIEADMEDMFVKRARRIGLEVEALRG